MPTNITRGNVEGLIAIKFPIIPYSTSVFTTTEFDFPVPGVLATDVVISVSMPYYVNAFSIGNARVKANNIVSITFVSGGGAQTPPVGTYTLILGRLSDGYSLPTVSF